MSTSTNQAVTSFTLRDALPFPKWVDQITLAANTAEAYTVPTNAHYIHISTPSAIHARISGVAVTAIADVITGAGSMLISSEWKGSIPGGTVLSLISTGTPTVTIAAYP